MKTKNVVSVALLLFVAASVVYLIVDESLSRRQQDQASSLAAMTGPTLAQTAPGPRHRLVVYYFHWAQRCRTCLNMEAYAEEALREGLSDALEAGNVEWRAVNVEEPQNEHFVEDYELTASSLVMVVLEDGQQKLWKNLEGVWDLVDDESRFKAYVLDEARAYLEGDS